MPPEIAVYPDLNAVSRAAAETIAQVAEAAVAKHNKFTIALSGGSTPRALYCLLAAEYQHKIPWNRAEIFFGDERCVSPESHDSNYGMARTAFLELIPGLLSRTHRIEGELPPEEAAQKYDEVLHAAFSGGADPSAAATFDILLLGVGTDGHTASLFPSAPALDENHLWAVATQAPLAMSVRHRITLTYPILNAAHHTLILCAGSDKQKILHDILTAPPTEAAARYPVARITARDRLVWMMDQAAHS